MKKEVINGGENTLQCVYSTKKLYAEYSTSRKEGTGMAVRYMERRSASWAIMEMQGKPTVLYLLFIRLVKAKRLIISGFYKNVEEGFCIDGEGLKWYSHL